MFITNRIYFGWLTTKVSLHPIVTCTRHFLGGNILQKFLESYFRSFSPFGPTQNFHCIRKNTTATLPSEVYTVEWKAWTNFTTGTRWQDTFTAISTLAVTVASRLTIWISPHSSHVKPEKFPPVYSSTPCVAPPIYELGDLPYQIRNVKLYCHVENIMLVNEYHIVENRAQNYNSCTFNVLENDGS